MSEKEKEKEDHEDGILDHFYHRHPLGLAVVGRHSGRCYGCRKYIYPKETAYRCREQCWYPILHEECAEMPREITLSMHPQHTLIQKEVWHIPSCALCKKDIIRIGYYCATSDRCGFQVHVGCAQSIAAVRSSMDHPSHPHQLTLLWRPGRSCSFRCDACGIVQKGSSYICSDCQYWIHESCATLPTTKDFPYLHRHSLSLAFHVPPEYVRFDFQCHVCYKDLLPRYWVYHCETCRYVVHIKCATGNISDMVYTKTSGADDEDVIEFPMNNPTDELIGSFVAKTGGATSIPNETADGKCMFHNHDHLLHLISSTLHDQVEEEKVANSDEDDDNSDEFHYGNMSQLVCDGCTMPISQPKHEPSSSSYKYLSCGECKYFLHSTCFRLPPHLPSHPLHPEPGHDLTLRTSPKLNLTYCNICGFHTNGLYYECNKCSSFKADVKCASLPGTIKHKAHPRHLLKLLNQKDTRDDNYWERLCGACGRNTYGNVCYTCEVCEIVLHASCSLLPVEAAANPTWDKHALPLTFDASADHPGDFYCDACEKEMNPKRWMYHCRECDVSVHPNCLTTAAGKFRNIKFRQRYLFAGAHEHPVEYRLLAAKLRCDVCGERKDYGCRGFQCCTEKCGFFMCLNPCGQGRRGDMQAVD